MPIRLGKIRSNHKILVAKGFKHLFGNVGFGIFAKRAIHHAIIGLFGVKHTEAIVVFGGEHQVFHTRRFGSSGPFVGIKIGRIKSGLQVFVGFFVAVPIVGVRSTAFTPAFILGAKTPTFHNAPLAVGAPVHQEAEFYRLPLLQFLLHLWVGRRDVLRMVLFGVLLGKYNLTK